MDKKRMGFALLVGVGMAACSSNVTGMMGDAMVAAGDAVSGLGDALSDASTVRAETVDCVAYDQRATETIVTTQWFARTDSVFDPARAHGVVRLRDIQFVGGFDPLCAQVGPCSPDIPAGRPPAIGSALVLGYLTFDAGGHAYVSCGATTTRSDLSGRPATSGYHYETVDFEITE